MFKFTALITCENKIQNVIIIIIISFKMLN